MATCLIAIGSNLALRHDYLDKAIDAIEQQPAIRLMNCSSYYESKSIGGPAQQRDFLNTAITIETSLAPIGLLDVLQNIENQFGRQRKTRWAARTLDLDLLLYDDLVIETERLTIPHPRMAFRRFVLEPAAQIAGNWRHPTTSWTIQKLLHHLQQTAWYIAIAGPEGIERTQLAKQLAEKLKIQLILKAEDSSHLKELGSASISANDLLKAEKNRLAANVQLLDKKNNLDREKCIISDFWFDQSLLSAEQTLDQPSYEQYQRHWKEARKQVLTPRLVILFEAPLPTLQERNFQQNQSFTQNHTDQSQLKSISSLNRLVNRSETGPILRLSIDNPQLALQEASAAVEAIR